MALFMLELLSKDRILVQVHIPKYVSHFVIFISIRACRVLMDGIVLVEIN